MSGGTTDLIQVLKKVERYWRLHYYYNYYYYTLFRRLGAPTPIGLSFNNNNNEHETC